MLCLVKAGGHIVYTLPDDAQTLAHLFNPHNAAVIAVAVLCSRHLEFKLVIA